MNNSKIIAIDGHDGSGKTTIAHMLADKRKAKYVKPFSDSLGDMIAWSFRKGEYDFANKLAIAAVEKIHQENRGIDLVFDRHWLSMFTIIPESLFWSWQHRPLTILCWADVPTTIARLKDRNSTEVDEWDHKHYCRLYREIAEREGTFIVNTTTPSDAEERLAEIERYLAQLNFDTSST